MSVRKAGLYNSIVDKREYRSEYRINRGAVMAVSYTHLQVESACVGPLWNYIYYGSRGSRAERRNREISGAGFACDYPDPREMCIRDRSMRE